MLLQLSRQLKEMARNRPVSGDVARNMLVDSVRSIALIERAQVLENGGRYGATVKSKRGECGRSHGLFTSENTLRVEHVKRLGEDGFEACEHGQFLEDRI